MAKDPAFLFYPGDWMGGTQWLNMEQKGCYIELLILQFNTGGFTLAQAKQVLSICFDVARPVLEQKFILADGRYFNERLKIEIEKRRKFTESRRDNALAVNYKGKRKPTNAKHMLQHMENENENENEDIIIDKINNSIENFENAEITEIINSDFEKFRTAYPGTKRGYQTEFDNFKKKHKDWKKILPDLYDHLQDQIRARDYIRTLGGFLPQWKNLSTYINNRAWEETINTSKHEINRRDNQKGATDFELAETISRNFANDYAEAR